MILFLNKVTFWTAVSWDFNISNPCNFHPKCPHALFILSSAVPENCFSLFTEALWMQTICITPLISPPSPPCCGHQPLLYSELIFNSGKKKKINDWYVGQFLVLSQKTKDQGSASIAFNYFFIWPLYICSCVFHLSLSCDPEIVNFQRSGSELGKKSKFITSWMNLIWCFWESFDLTKLYRFLYRGMDC